MSAQLEYFKQCKSNSEWQKKVTGSNGEIYIVSWEYRPSGPYQYAMECTCKGFQYRGTCRHVIQAEKERCGWHQQFDGGDVKDGKCPQCGGEVESVACAV